MLVTKGIRFRIGIILVYPLVRGLSVELGTQEIMQELQLCRPFLDQLMIRLLLPCLSAFRRRKRLVSSSWRMDATCIKVKAPEVSLPRGRQSGKTVDFLLTAKRDRAAALRFFDKAMRASVFLRRSRWTKRRHIKAD
jgi:hypothetical protein